MYLFLNILTYFMCVWNLNQNSKCSSEKLSVFVVVVSLVSPAFVFIICFFSFILPFVFLFQQKIDCVSSGGKVWNNSTCRFSFHFICFICTEHVPIKFLLSCFSKNILKVFEKFCTNAILIETLSKQFCVLFMKIEAFFSES